MTDITNYNSYIESEEWKEKAWRIRERDGYRCQICGANDVPLEVHHLTYDRLYDEDDGDLITVCHACHKKITESWHYVTSGVKTRNRFLGVCRRYEYAEGVANQLNALMPYDISFGGRYVLTGTDNIKAACNAAGVEYKYAGFVNDKFNKIHILDVSMQIAQGMQRWKLKQDGYPSGLVDNIKARRDKIFGDDIDISDEFVCYMHEGRGKWTVVADDDGLDTMFGVTFVPFARYGIRWWDNE